MSRSSRSQSSERSRQKVKTSRHKMFVTNLDGTAKQDELKSELEQLFSKYGTLKELSVKKSKNAQYSFAFIQYEMGQDAEEAIRNLNNHQIKGKPMKVQYQDDTKRRKDPEKGCYTCGKKGHFARECRSKNTSSTRYRDRRQRSYSSQSSQNDRKKKRKRSESKSSEKRHKKDKKHSEKDKKKKKHKKSRHRSSSSDSHS